MAHREISPCCRRWPSHHYPLPYNSMERRKAAWERRAGRLFSKHSNHPAKTALAPKSTPGPLLPAPAGLWGGRAAQGTPQPGGSTRGCRGMCPAPASPQRTHGHWKCRPAPSPVLRSLATPTKKGNMQGEHTACEQRQSVLCSL